MQTISTKLNMILNEAYAARTIALNSPTRDLIPAMTEIVRHLNAITDAAAFCQGVLKAQAADAEMVARVDQEVSDYEQRMCDEMAESIRRSAAEEEDRLTESLDAERRHWEMVDSESEVAIDRADSFDDDVSLDTEHQSGRGYPRFTISLTADDRFEIYDQEQRVSVGQPRWDRSELVARCESLNRAHAAECDAQIESSKAGEDA